MKTQIKRFLLTLGFMTRIPVNVDLGEVKDEDMHKGFLYYPVVGLILGLCDMAVFLLVSLILPEVFGILFAMLANLCLTGAFHLDGLSDTADGIYSARTRERMLEIMKDSRIGTNGAVAMCFDLALKFAGIYYSDIRWLMILLMPIAGILFFFAKIFAPLAVLLSVSSSLLLRIIGINPEEEQEVVTEEEIRMMLAEGKEQGTIQNEESKLIQNVFEFNDTTAEQVSTRRRDLVCLNLEDNAEEWEKTIRECRFSHFPIIDSNQEDVVGILDTKDYFRSEDKSKEYVMKHAVDTPYFVPENMKANVLFANMKQTRIYFAVVLDEYGGMSGIVTLHDLVEALVGELEEEEMPAKPEDIERIAEGVWRIQGCAQLDEVSEVLNVEFSEIFDTFSGFVWDAIGRVPAEGEKFSIEANGLKIDVENIKNHMVDYAIVRKIPRKKIEKEPEE